MLGSMCFLLILVVLGKLMERKPHSGVYRAWLVPLPTSAVVGLFYT